MSWDRLIVSGSVRTTSRFCDFELRLLVALGMLPVLCLCFQNGGDADWRKPLVMSQCFALIAQIYFWKCLPFTLPAARLIPLVCVHAHVFACM